MMGKLIKLILALSIFLLVSASLKAWVKQENPIKLRGVVIDDQKKDAYDKIHVRYNVDDWFSESGFVEKSVKIDSNGNFEFNLPDLNKPYKIVMVIMAINTSFPKKLWSGDYYVESNDDIKMELVINTQTVFFSGIGGMKYNLVTNLKGLYNKYFIELARDTLFKTYDDPVIFEAHMDKFADLIRKYICKNAALINDAKISHKMGTILNFEYGKYFQEWRFRTELICQKNPTYRKNGFNKYLQYSDEFFNQPNKYSVICPKYLTEISIKDAFEQCDSSSSGKIGIVSFYNSRKLSYDGRLRDRLIAACFFAKSIISQYAQYPQATYDSLLKDASEYVNDPIIKNAINRQINTSSRLIGKKVFEGNFIGLNNKNLNLKSLRGKVILIDTWFNGCYGCASFHKVFQKEIYPKFKDDSNFVVLSINIDKNKDRWLKGIDSKLYTANEHLNVWTGSGINHPFMEYYGIKGAPYLMLIDVDGNICYRPNGGVSTALEWTQQISKALN